MIDYDKLKLAHELANKIATERSESCTISLFYYGASDNDFYNLNSYTIGELAYDSIDKLITKLKELTKPITKYEIGQQIWLVDFVTNSPDCYVIKDIDYDSTEKYLIEDEWFAEDELYPNKEQLIDAQIEYWNKLKIENFTPKFEGEIKGFKCQHEDTGVEHVFYYDDGREFTMAKCKKCGEYYK